MRADRLLSIMMLLQSRGKMTAKALAEELEVSERTIYRDMTALSTAGVPVYCERGPGGGCALMESYRTDLTGLSTDEIRALFMLNVPAPLAELGVDQELKAALFKLTAALPDRGRLEERKTRQRIYLDPSWWDQPNELGRALHIIQQALWQDRKLIISFRTIQEILISREVLPLGLVAKGNVWYLVWRDESQTDAKKVSQIEAAELTAEVFVRPQGFNLAAFWEKWCIQYETARSVYPVRVRVSPQLAPYFPGRYGKGLASVIERSLGDHPYQWVELEINFEHFFEARDQALSWGGGAEVLAPTALRESILDHARQVLGCYEQE
jgi:predicted DNA-binding transcriptional regulator YafY